jgi:hypothetical protein
MLLIALSALSGVAYLAHDVLAEAHARAQTAADSEQAATRTALNERLRALAQDTEETRAQLEALAGRDVVSIIDTIESVGGASATRLTVSSALSGGEGVSVPGGTEMRPIIFVLEIEGSYASTVHAVSLLENLSLPSFIDQVSLRRAAEGGAQRWHATVHVRVYTTAPISS